MKKSKTADIALLKNAALFSLSVHAWGNRKTVGKGKAQTDAADALTHTTKTLIVCDELKAVYDYQGKVWQWVVARVMPSFLMDSLYFASTKREKGADGKHQPSIAEVIAEHIEAANINLQTVLLPKLLDDRDEAGRSAYDRAKLAAAKPKIEGGLGSLYAEADYPQPEDLKRRFYISHNFVDFRVSENLIGKMRRKEEEKLRSRYGKAEQAMVAALRAGVQEMVRHLLEILTVKPGEKRKKVHKSLLTNWKELFDTFAARNLMEDEQLASVVKQAEGILSGVTDVDELKGDESAQRDKVLEQFKALEPVIDKLVEDSPVRKFNWD